MSRKFFIKIISLLGLISVFILPLFAFAQTQITISTSVPGTYGPTVGTGGPGAFIANFYQFALIIGGVLAFGVLVYGGIRYMTSAGNPSGASDAKEWIEAALLGLLLLAGAYFILSVVNPQLLNLNLPNLQVINIATPTSIGGTAPTTGTGTTGTGCAGTACQSLSADGLTCKPANQQPNGQASCSAAQGMVTTLNCIQSAVGTSDFTVSESMPPTVPHESKCHNNGCCVDTTLNNPTCAQVQQLVNAAQSCGATVANEYSNCNGTTYATTQGNNVHINSAKGGGC